MTEIKQIQTLADLVPDDKNANRGTARGDARLEESLEKFGGGRGVVTDFKGSIIAGNKTVEKAMQLGMEDVIVVQSDGRKLIVIQRTDIDLNTPRGREMALADNKVGQDNLNWDPGTLDELLQDGVLVADWFDEDELNNLLRDVPETLDNHDLDPQDREIVGETTSTDGLPAVTPDNEVSQQGQYLTFGATKIPMSAEEAKELLRRLAQYRETNGVYYGFVGELLQLGEEDEDSRDE